MKALLLAGGLGTRLRPLTNVTPKCLVPINGKPLLEIWLNNLRRAGIGPFMINTHHLSEKVKEFIGNQQNKDIFLSHEDKLLGTAGTLTKHLSFFKGEDFMFIHADNYCKLDLKTVIESHKKRPKSCLLTMIAFRSPKPSSCGIVELDEHNVVTSFVEKPKNPRSNLANGAVYILSKEFLKIFEADYANANDFSIDVLPHFLKKIYCYETKDVFMDIGTPEAYDKAQLL